MSELDYLTTGCCTIIPHATLNRDVWRCRLNVLHGVAVRSERVMPRASTSSRDRTMPDGTNSTDDQ